MKPTKPRSKPPEAGGSAHEASRLIDTRIEELSDWRGRTLARVRSIIRRADPAVVEEWKWNVPVWSCAVGRGGGSGAGGKIICTGETYKNAVKLTFAKGASLPDPSGLFNSSLDGKTRRAIDIHEGDAIDAAGLKALVKAAVNDAADRPIEVTRVKATAASKRPAKPLGKSRLNATTAGSRRAARGAGKPVTLLSGGNPQIPKGEGDSPVQAYISAMPGWKREVGRRLDALITRTVPDPPGVRKAVKWNSPLYGLNEPNQTGGSQRPSTVGRWFLSIHCFDNYVKVAFFRGTSLRPMPPGASRQKEVRYLDIREDDQFDEAQLSSWVRQASRLPGEKM